MPPEDNKDLSISQVDIHHHHSMNSEVDAAGVSPTLSSKTSAKDIPLVEVKLQNVSYSPITKSAKVGAKSATQQRTTILSNISTHIAPYQLHAWMGPSGSGKSSLVSVVANLVEHADIGEQSVITVNGEEGRIPKRLVGVVWQDDLLLSNLTVEENVYYAAKLKMPEKSTPDSVVREIVRDSLEELGLTSRKDSLVGSALSAKRGVSGGERKRVSVAVELVGKPSLLILDEPTSGLDSTTSQQLIKTLKNLASHGHSIAVVIHQPRTAIFNMFDHLLLLSKGNMVFDGPPTKVRSYLEACPTVDELPPETGIADWIMDVISEDELGAKTLPSTWSTYNEKDNSDAPRSTELSRKLSSLRMLQSGPRFETSFWTQLKLLTQRTGKQQRGERLTMTSVILQIAYVFFTSLFWWRMPDTTGWIFERNSLLFFVIIAQGNAVVINAVTVFHRERILLQRERSKKMYGVGSFFIAKTLSDMTNNVLLPVAYGMVVYWTGNLRMSAAAFVKYLLGLYLTISTAQSMGLFLSILIPSVELALVLAAPLTLFVMILGGFYQPLSNMHAGVYWATWLSFARYGYSALLVNEYLGRDIPCADESDVSIQIGGSEICPRPGEEVLTDLGIVGISSDFWFNIGMMICLQIVFRVAAYMFLRRSK